MSYAALASIPFMLSARDKIQSMMGEINQRCGEMQLPYAFYEDSIDEEEACPIVLLRGNSDYQFENLGFVFRFPPKLSFWVHYKKGTPEHKTVGRFLMDLNALEEISFNFFPRENKVQLVGRLEEV